MAQRDLRAVGQLASVNIIMVNFPDYAWEIHFLEYQFGIKQKIIYKTYRVG